MAWLDSSRLVHHWCQNFAWMPQKRKYKNRRNNKIWRQINFANSRESKGKKIICCYEITHLNEWLINTRRKTMRCNRIWLWIWMIIIIIYTYFKPQTDFLFSLFLFSFYFVKQNIISFFIFLPVFVCVYSVWQMSGHFQLFMTHSIYVLIKFGNQMWMRLVECSKI